MKTTFKGIVAAIVCAAAVCSCVNCKMGTYAYDSAFLADNSIETVELESPDGKSLVMLVPAWQGRVVTTSADGRNGDSYGWINYDFVKAGKVSPQFNPVGGEERLWFGPEGGKFSYYFKKGEDQIYENWRVPAIEDTETFKLVAKSDDSAEFEARATLMNASDNSFDMGIRRKVTLLSREKAAGVLGLEIPEKVKFVGYTSENTLTNCGDRAWTKETGLPSIWMLGCFNPTPTTTVFIPYNQEHEGRIVKDDYFGKVPSARLIVENGLIRFKIDGEYRSKIGLPVGSAKDVCGSWDSAKKVLTILKYTVPQGDVDYVNGQWGEQDSPFGGDVINSYNDGPTETGYVQGPFYEIETSSPGAALEAGGSITHCQSVFHLQGSEDELNAIALKLFGVTLEEVGSTFVK